MDKVDREMGEAMAKHGPVTLPDNSHYEEFYNRIEAKKATISQA